MAKLTIKNLITGYGKKEVLRNISFELRENGAKGSIFLGIGPNGAGKSTLLKAIAGVLPAWKGEIHLDGEPIHRLSCAKRTRRGIIYFPQRNQLFPSLSVRENLDVGLLRVPKKERQSRLEEIYEIFPEVPDWLNKRAGLLSGGQRKQAALGMCLLSRPRLLLLDEPSADLSPDLVKTVLQKVQEINQKMGIPVLLVEQKIGNALKIAHRVLVMKNGVVALETDRPKSLADGKKLEKVFFEVKV